MNLLAHSFAIVYDLSHSIGFLDHQGADGIRSGWNYSMTQIYVDIQCECSVVCVLESVDGTINFMYANREYYYYFWRRSREPSMAERLLVHSSQAG